MLPAVPNGKHTDTAIAITHKSAAGYEWLASDPQGYAAWFDAKNKTAFTRHAPDQKRALQRLNPRLYRQVDDVPDQLVRTPLQRAIQLMKRHRDVYFSHSKDAAYVPISIILTTLAAHLYTGEDNPHSALIAIVSGLLGHTALLENRSIVSVLATMRLIRRLPNGRWQIANPVNPAENFAGRWHEDSHARARAFFSWVRALQADILISPTNLDPSRLKKHLDKVLGGAVVTSQADFLVPTSQDVSPRRHIRITKPAKPWSSA